MTQLDLDPENKEEFDNKGVYYASMLRNRDASYYGTVFISKHSTEYHFFVQSIVERGWYGDQINAYVLARPNTDPMIYKRY